MRCQCLLLLTALIVGSCASRKPPVTAAGQIEKDSASLGNTFLHNLLSQHPQFFDSILKQNEKWQVKIVYTQIDRGKDNEPYFTHYFFNAGSQYFYPASTVKMPAAFLALQKLNEINIPGMDKESAMITEVAGVGQTPVYNDPQSADGKPSVANYIRKIFLVSDNDAFNRLYEFLGQEYFNNSLHKMGYDSTQILHRLQLSLSEEQNRNTNPVKFYDTDSKLLHTQPLAKSNLPYQPRHTFWGTGYLSNGKLVNAPFDFSKKNRIGLVDLHSMLQTAIFPEAVAPAQRFKLTDDDYRFLYRYMSMKPGESRFPQYDSGYTGAYSKFLMYGGKGDMEDGIRIFNKEGDAYGFLTDVAYILDFKNGVEFFLSANIYCNTDGIFNDDKYDYEKVGLPFLKNLGRVVYEYELKRKKKREPDLSKFRIDYTK